MKKLILLILIVILAPSNICGETCLTIGNSALIIEGSQFVAIQSSRIFDEKFEGAGYEEAGASETVGAGCTIDEDADSADAGSPSGWGSQCLKLISLSGVTNYVTWCNFGPQAISYFRFEIVVTSESFDNDQGCNIVEIQSDGWGTCFKLTFYQSGGVVILHVLSYHDGASHAFACFSNLSLNTRYRIEVKWDATDNAWAWEVDGVAQSNNIDNSNPVTSEGTLTGAHETDCDHLYIGNTGWQDADTTIYYDLIAIDDADWVGAEG